MRTHIFPPSALGAGESPLPICHPSLQKLNYQYDCFFDLGCKKGNRRHLAAEEARSCRPAERGRERRWILHTLYICEKLTQQGRNEKLFNWYFKGDLFMRLVFSRQCFIQVNVHLKDLERWKGQSLHQQKDNHCSWNAFVSSPAFNTVTLWHHTMSPCDTFAQFMPSSVVVSIVWVRHVWADQSEGMDIWDGGALKRKEYEKADVFFEH